MLDTDLADLYGVKTRVLKQAVQLDKQDKNIKMMFQYLDELVAQKLKPELPRKSIGYKPAIE